MAMEKARRCRRRHASTVARTGREGTASPVPVHLAAVVVAHALSGESAWLFCGMQLLAKPEGYGFPMPVVYAAWIAIVAALYPLCRRFAALKQRRRDWWLSYL